MYGEATRIHDTESSFPCAVLGLHRVCVLSLSLWFSFMNQQTAVWYPDRLSVAGGICVLQCSASCSLQCNGIADVCLCCKLPRPNHRASVGLAVGDPFEWGDPLPGSPHKVQSKQEAFRAHRDVFSRCSEFTNKMIRM